MADEASSAPEVESKEQDETKLEEDSKEGGTETISQEEEITTTTTTETEIAETTTTTADTEASASEAVTENNVDTAVTEAPVEAPVYEQQNATEEEIGSGGGVTEEEERREPHVVEASTQQQEEEEQQPQESDETTTTTTTNNNNIHQSSSSSSNTGTNAIPLPAYIRVTLSSGNSFSLPVEVEAYRKPYMGGLKNTKTGLVYHHAYTQTPVVRVSKWANAPQRFTREAQTSVAVSKSQQVKREGGAQTNRSDLHHDAARDRVLIPRPYFTAAQLLEVKHAKALQIQCVWRGALSKKRAYEQRLALFAQAQAEARHAAAEAEAERRRLLEDIERRMHPRSSEDFAILYDEVEAWRVSETTRIHLETNGGTAEDEKARKSSMNALVAKEAALIATIERLRVVANKENRDTRVSTMMETMSAPMKYKLTTGDDVLVTTPLATRAAELKALYDALCGANLANTGVGSTVGAGAVNIVNTTTKGGVSTLGTSAAAREARLDILLNVKYTVKEFDCALTREIVSLIERETDMLSRGRPLTSVDGLRQRIKTLFQLFVQDPKFNPAAAAFTKDPPSSRDPKLLPSFLQPVAKKTVTK